MRGPLPSEGCTNTTVRHSFKVGSHRVVIYVGQCSNIGSSMLCKLYISEASSLCLKQPMLAESQC